MSTKYIKMAKIMFQMLAEIYIIIGCASRGLWLLLTRLAIIDTLDMLGHPNDTWRSNPA